MTMDKVNVLLRWNVSDEERALIESLWPAEANILVAPSGDLETLRPTLPDVDVMVGHVTAEIVSAAPRLKLIHVLGHGIESVLSRGVREVVADRKIAVAKANPAAISIAEFAIMCMIALTRRTFKFHEALAYQGSRNELLRAERIHGGIGGELYQSTLGIIGFGNIGREIALRARAFGMMLGAVCRHPDRIEKEAYGIQFAAPLDGLTDFLSRCRYVVLCLPGTPATRDVMNHERFAALPDGAYLVNVARGGLIVEEALYDALRSGKLAGAALDVHRNEAAKKLSGYPFPFPIHHYNVILTPHYAGSTYEGRVRALRTIGENLRRLAHGKPLLNLANLEEGY